MKIKLVSFCKAFRTVSSTLCFKHLLHDDDNAAIHTQKVDLSMNGFSIYILFLFPLTDK